MLLLHRREAFYFLSQDSDIVADNLLTARQCLSQFPVLCCPSVPHVFPLNIKMLSPSENGEITSSVRITKLHPSVRPWQFLTRLLCP